MKHVFSVTSNLTFAICNKIVEVENIHPEDCILFLVRDYQIPEEYNSIYTDQIPTSYNVAVDKGRVFAGANVFKTKRNIQDFDRLVDAHIKNEDYVWYSSVCSNDLCSLMVTKKNCKGYYVFEDGGASYRDFNPQTFTGIRYWIYKIFLNPFCHRIFAVKNHFITNDHPKFKGCYATNERCFPLHQQYLKVIGSPFKKKEYDFHPDAVLSVDPLFLYIDNVTADRVYAQLAAYIQAKDYKCLAIKYHPRFNAQSNIEFKKIYADFISKYFGDNIFEIESGIILEELLETYKCDFYTANSSIAIYGATSGSTCYTYIPLLEPYTNAFDSEKLIKELCVAVR